MRKVALLTVVLLVALHSCDIVFNGMKGSGNVVNKDFEIKEFESIDVGGGFDVYIKKGDEPSVRLMADDNFIPHIEIVSDGYELRISSRKSFRRYKALKVFITYTDLSRLDASGGTDVQFENRVIADDFKLRMSGGSDAKIDIEAKKLDVNLSGGADLKLKHRGNEFTYRGSGGSDCKMTLTDLSYSNFELSGGADADVVGDAVDLDLRCSGGSDFSGIGFKVKNANVNTSGAADARLYVSENISVNASGASSINYEGGAKLNKKSVGAASSVRGR